MNPHSPDSREPSEHHEPVNGAESLIPRAVELLRAGRLVAFPTETVYGLGADASNPAAVQRIFTAKGRPSDHPLIVHLSDSPLIDRWARLIPEFARHLAARFWPGPLTLILPRQSSVCDAVTGGLDTVGLRVPAHPLALALLRAFDGGIAAPSANRFGRVSPTRAEHVREELGESVDLILDGGPCSVGLESTIVDATGARPVILRPGGVTRESMERLLGMACADATESSPRAPGRLASHYAPQARVELVERGRLLDRALAALEQGLHVAVLSTSPSDFPTLDRLVVLTLPREIEAQAQSLYGLLRDIDRVGCDTAFVELPDEAGLGAAVADRLRKAAGQG